MADTPEKDKSSEAPAPEVLKPQSGHVDAPAASGGEGDKKPATPLRRHHGSYRPSHKATFFGLSVIALILAVNGGIIFFVMRGGTSKTDTPVDRNTVTLSTESLNKLGVDRNQVGNLGTQLTIGPDTKFNGKVTIAGNTSIGGQLQLNGTFSATSVSASSGTFAKLQAGDATLQSLSLNSDLTANNLIARSNLNVTAAATVQGTLTVAGLTTINNSLNVAGNLAIGGTLSVRNFQVNTLTIAGHLLSSGAAPGVSPAGGALGSNGTVSISGNDTSGTVGVNIGAGASAGCLVTVSFRQGYQVTPHVTFTGSMPANIYLSGRTASGFTICTASPLSPGGYFVDYIVVQ